jgi:hypothetical protein
VIELGVAVGAKSAAINEGASQGLRFKKVESASDLAMRNIIEAGFFYNSIFVILEMISVYKAALIELEDQEKQFWSLPIG